MVTKFCEMPLQISSKIMGNFTYYRRLMAIQLALPPFSPRLHDTLRATLIPCRDGF
jgi:hypothetical protein